MPATHPPLPCHRLKERALWAKGIIEALRGYGRNLVEQLPEDLLSYASPSDFSLGHISQTDMNRLWYCAVTLSGDECFGLRMGVNFSTPTMQLLNLAAHSSPTAGVAIHRVLRFIQLFSTQIQLYSLEAELNFTDYLKPKEHPHPLQFKPMVRRGVA